MNYAAIWIKSESGDNYLKLVEYNSIDEVIVKLKLAIHENPEYFSEWDVECSKTSDSKKIDRKIWEMVNQEEL